MMALGFESRVAVVTGAGGGLGREHALLLASRGARVVVNDVGGSISGEGSSGGPAQRVVEEIVDAGGEAVANTSSVSTADGAAEIVETAMDHFGRIDIVINNAGILRDRSFAKLSDAEILDVLGVHLLGGMYVTRAAWNHMRERAYGRVVFTSSAAGIFGNFGQANYAAAKMGLWGLSNALAVEGAKFNVTSNVIAPIARTRMTEQLLGARLIDRVDPRLVSPLVAWLAHEECPVSGHVYTVGGGRVARLFVGMCTGWTQREGDLTVEDVRDHFDQIEDPIDAAIPVDINDDFRALARALR